MGDARDTRNRKNPPPPPRGGGWGALRGNRLGSLLSAVLAIAPSEIARVERKADDAPHQKQTRKKKRETETMSSAAPID